MLSIKNQADFEKIKKYGRGADMCALYEWFPELCAFRDLYVVESESDYNENVKTLGAISRKRPDTLIGEKVIKGIHKGTADENLDIMRYIKRCDPNGVMIMFTLKAHTAGKRYEGEGGMSVAVDLGKSVVIECVGAGFDGGDLTHGAAVHESYLIGWGDIPKFNLGNRKSFRIYLVDDERYKAQVAARGVTLEKYGYAKGEFKNAVPTKYAEMGDDVFQFIMPTVKRLYGAEAAFRAGGMNTFSINGEIERGKFVPIQMQTEARHKKLCKQVKGARANEHTL
jgi:hypothetical protein